MCSYCNSAFGLILRYECIYLLRIACSVPFVRWDKQYIPFDIFFTLGSIFSWQKCRKKRCGAASHSAFCICSYLTPRYSPGVMPSYFLKSAEKYELSGKPVALAISEMFFSEYTSISFAC